MNTKYFTAPGVEKTQSAHRYMCQLASNELELDRDSIPVHKHFQIVNLGAPEPTETVIMSLIAAVGWLSGYTIVAHWPPDDGVEF